MPEKSLLLSALSPEKLQHLIDRLKSSNGTVAPEAQRIPRRPEGQERTPLSFSQERLWFLDRLEPGAPTYNIPLAVAMQGELRYEELARSLRELVRRHEALRTVFESVEGTPWQRVSPTVEGELAIIDLEGLPDLVQEAEAERLASFYARWSFDLEKGPLLRAALLRFDRAAHRFLLVLHHIVGDGWSRGVLVREIAALYEAFTAGRPSQLPDLPIQYPDFAFWQRHTYLEVRAKGLSYWLEKLAGCEPLEMPADRPRPTVQTYRGGNCSRVFSPELSRRLRDFGRSCEATLFMVLLALLKAVLLRHSGQEDLVVGSPIAGRGKTETEGLIGCFLNNLALRTSLSGDPSLRELVARVRQVTLDAYSYQDVPFEALLAKLPLERDPSRTPLFQVLFNMLNFLASELYQAGLTLRMAALPPPPSKFEMTFYVLENEQGIGINLVYNADLFDEARMVDLLDQLFSLAEQAVERPTAPLSGFSLITSTARRLLPDAREKLDASWMGAVHELFLEQTGRAPERSAVEDRQGAWSYRDLDRVSSRVAGWLQAQGVGRGDVVAIYAHRSAAVVPAVLGTLRAGATFALLDPAYPAARLAEIAGIAAPKALVRLEAAGPLPHPFVERLTAMGSAVLNLPSGGVGAALDGLAGCPAGTPVGVGPDDIACLGFTSGSTGLPKAIRGRHGSLSHFLPWHCERFGLTGEDRFSLLSGLAHDPLQRDIFTPLFLGASIVVPDPDEMGNPGWLAAWMIRERVTVSHLTPAMAQLLTEGADGLEIACLRLVLLIGDILTRRDVARIRTLVPGVTCVNLYGATETQRALAMHVVDSGEGAQEAAIQGKHVLPLGRGMRDVQLLVLNPAGGLAGIGELGEIAVRSPHLAQGYLGDDALTAQRFVVNPFTGEPGDRLYLTGDLGRYLPHGEVAFSGRSDSQLKIRGFRIELGEVEATLAGLAGVREAVVVAREEDGEKRLAAFAVPEVAEGRESRLTEGSLREALRERLPAYMVPASVEFLPSLPITPNGKVDRRALSQRARRTPAVDAGADTLPRTPDEELMAGIWAEVLRIDRVGVHDDFFALGGHSLLATKLAARIRISFNIELPLREIFEQPTVSGLAAKVLEKRRGLLGLSARPIVSVPRSGVLPLSFSQTRQWLLDQLEPGSAAYNISKAIRLLGPLNPSALGRVFQEVVRRHESLRTTFRAVLGVPEQVISPAAGLSLPVVDLAMLSGELLDGEMRRLAKEHARCAFSLTRGPLLLVALLRRAANEHVLLLNMHHIVSDGWSMSVLAQEIETLYGAFVKGEASPLPELPVQYADFAVWQRSWLAGEVLETQITYWREQLAGAGRALALPTDRPRPAMQSHAGASRPLVLSGELTAKLKAASGRRGVTLFMSLLATFEALLCRYTAETDFCVGTYIANRSRRETEQLIGFFVNTLVLRADVDGDPAWPRLLERVRQATLGAYDHQDLPFEMLLDVLQPERDLARTPLFQVMLVLQNTPRPTLEAAQLEFEPWSVEDATRANFDLTLWLGEQGGIIHGSLAYATDILDGTTIGRLLGHFETLLGGWLAAPDRPLSDVPILGASEEHQLLGEFQGQENPGRDACIHELFESRARQSPEALALVWGEESLTYRELDDRASQIAHDLAAAGVRPEIPVALCVERSPEMVAALLGILKAGGCCVPLDPSYPIDRIALILEDSKAGVLVTTTSQRDRLPGDPGGLRRIYLDREHGAIAAGTMGNSAPSVDARSLAYVFYTSGSTGRPKGVQLEHHSMAAYALTAGLQHSLGPEDRVLQFASIGFDTSAEEIFSCLAYGATLVLPPHLKEELDPEQFLRRCSEWGITVLDLPTAYWHELVLHGGELPPQVRLLIIGGEMARPDLLARWRARSGHRAQLVNTYGPTEATIVATTWTQEETFPLTEHWPGVPIGRPIPGARALLERSARLVPLGVVGEILLGGVGVSRGYLGRPDLTAERFVPDPYGSWPGERLYRTGDLARHLPDGALSFLGRVDGQVKLRGVRIEPTEIESALAAHPAVRQAVVILREDRAGQPRLVGYVVADAEVSPSREELRHALRRRLPEIMVPADLVFLAELPLSPNGKVDRRALPQPEAAVDRTGRPAPRTPIEEVVAAIWSEVLGVDGVDREANFFDLGGHSLLATQVVARVRRKLAVELPLRSLFEGPTLAEMATAIEQARQRTVALPLVASPRHGGTGEQIEFPLSFAQERLWFIDHLMPGGNAYTISTGLRLHGELKVAALEQALGEIVRRHEALRTVFSAYRGQPVQRILAAASILLPEIDLSALPAPQAAAAELAASEIQRPFDLSGRCGLLLRINLFRLAPAEHLLLICMHHIVSDAWSIAVFARELSVLYASFSQGLPAALPVLPVQYGDFSLWQRQWLEGGALAHQLSYWHEHLAGAPPLLELPADRPRPPRPSGRGALVRALFPRGLSAALAALARERGATLFMVVTAAFNALVQRLSGQTDLLIGTPIANRNRVELEGLIGFFVNTLVLRTQVSRDLAFHSLVDRVHEVALSAYTYQDVPFERLVEDLVPQRSLAYSPLFQIVLALQNAPAGALDLPGLTLAPLGDLAPNRRRAKFDLTATLEAREPGLFCSFEYNIDLFDRVSMDRLLEQFRSLLESAMGDSTRQIAELDLLSEPQRHQLTREWNRHTETDGATTLFCLHHRFELQAAAAPEKIAVVFPGDPGVRLSYDQLNQRANRLAHRLIALGVGPEVRVGLLLERSPDLVVALLAVLKAGGAYVPIDPAYPEERIAYFLTDSHAPILVTDRSLAGHPVSNATVLYLGPDEVWLRSGRNDDPHVPVAPENLAYLLYTSGSTGKPKGVLVSHGNVARLFTATEKWFGFSGNDVWTLFHSYAFDFSVWELWGALLYGGCAVVVPHWTSRSPEAFAELLEGEGVTILNQTPSSFGQLMRVERMSSKRNALRLVIFGGEALDLAALKPWIERHGASSPRLVNMYGITETTVHVTCRPLSVTDIASGTSSRIGGAIDDLDLRLLDAALRPVPVGVVGELYVGGAGLARGYLHREDLTAERFLPDPFAELADAGARLYRTGDLARYRGNGDLEYLGRSDHQVKIRGFRIELGEIEAALAEHPMVRQAVVASRPAPVFAAPGGAGAEPRLVAYVLPQQSKSPGTEELRSFLKAKLSAPMVPAVFMVLDSLPLTSHGKIDRRKLPDPGFSRPALESGYSAPSSPTESALAEIWANVLGLDQVGIDDNFFALGGDSIRSVRVLALARERQLDISLEQLFRFQTIRELAYEHDPAAVTCQVSAPTGPFSLLAEEDLRLLPDGLEDAYPVARLQAGMLFHGELDPEARLYHNITTLRLRAPLEINILHSAVRDLITRHAVLRTSFAFHTFAEPLQLVHRTVPTPFTVEDLTGLAPGAQERLLSQWFDEEKERHFDAAVAPLFRIHVHELGVDTFQLSVTEHHAILDGWSLAVFLTELFKHYFFLIGRYDRPLSPVPPAAFRRFVSLEQEALASEKMRSYWRMALAGEPPGSIGQRLSGARSRARVEVRHMLIPLPEDLCLAADKLSERAGVPLRSVLLTAHLRVLALATGRAEVVSGAVFNGRPEESGGDQALGLFLNTLPLRMVLPVGSWLSLVQAVFAAECELLAHRRFPLAELQRWNGGERLYEAVFDYVHFHVYESLSDLDGIELLESRMFSATDFLLLANFSRSVTSERLVLSFQYDPLRLSQPRAEEIASSYARVLRAMCKAPMARHDEADLLSRAQRHQLLVEWRTEEEMLRPLTPVHELFEQQALQRPAAIAVVAEGRELTYRELNASARSLAFELRELGIETDRLVGLFCERGVEMVIGMLAVLKSGGAYVALDPALPRDRLSWMLADINPLVILTQGDLASRLAESGPRVIVIDAARKEVEDVAVPAVAIPPESLAYVLYTSGSTGRPQGVAVEHRQLASYLPAVITRLQLNESTSFALVSTVAADLGHTVIFPSLTSGGCLHTVAQWRVTDGEGMAEYFARYTIDCMKIVPSHLSALTADVKAGRVLPRRHLVLGGEAASWEEIARLEPHAPGCRICNHYGPTETTVGVIACTLPAVGGERTGNLPLGRPLSGTEIYVLGPDGQPAPVEVPGELYIGGVGLSRGYLHRPDLTAGKFVPNPFGDRPGERLYRSGDRARFLPTGEIEFLGRVDHQVKIRGFRIEPQEVEAVLARHPSVARALVMLREDSPGDRRLVAYVVLRQQGEVIASELRTFLRGELPDFMVPSAFVELERLPLTANGKVDRRALPLPEAVGTISNEEWTAPRTPDEEVLAGLWERALSKQRIEPHDDFFTLGGHSLLAMRLVAQVCDVFGIELPVRALFEHPTIEGLARVVGRVRREKQGVSTPPLERIQRKCGAALPLSFAQQRLWFLHQIDPLSPTYHLQIAFELQGSLDVAALDATLSELVRRHEALRTRFDEIDGQPVQVVAPARRVPLAFVDITDIAGCDCLPMVRSLAAQQAAVPFSLGEAPLIRACLARFDHDHHAILLTVHHIVSDGWSMGLMIREMAILYQAFLAGRPSPLPELPVHYADFALWQRSWLRGEAMEVLSRYWKGLLVGAPALLELPFDRKRPPLPDNRGALRPYTIPEELASSLKRVAQQQKSTLFMTLLAAFKTLLHSYSGQDDMVVGTNIAGRTPVEVEGLVGFFINMLAIRTDLSGDPTFIELLGRVREVALGAYTHQEMPFAKVVDELRLERSLSYTPLFQAVLTLQPSMTPGEMTATPGLVLRPIGLGGAATPFDLIFNLSETATGVSGVVQYNAQLFKAVTIERLIERYSALLRLVAVAPERRLSEVREALFESLSVGQQEEFGTAARRAFKAARRQAVAIESGAYELMEKKDVEREY
jgi:amino acid adenylation domain-containing protein